MQETDAQLMERDAASGLALFGGEPVFAKPLGMYDVWPPVDDATASKLEQLYRSRRWTAFDQAEGVFADAFARHHGTRHGVFMVNGTVTLQCALGAYGIGPGDEVIVPALTWYATAMAAHYIGATPVFVDVEPDTLCIDPDQVSSAIGTRTKAIIPVHLYGSMANMDRIMAIAGENDLRVIEDCAHMHGGVWGGKHVGSIGDVGCFSFQQSKTMASGEGGICVTNDSEIAERLFRMKHIGYAPGQVPFDGRAGPPPGLLCYPFRATAFQALILHEQLPHLDDLLARYRTAADYLEARLSKTTKIRFQERGRKADTQGYYGWVMIFDDPEYYGIPIGAIRETMAAEGLPVSPTWGPVYSFNLFNLPPNAYRVQKSCPVAEHICDRMLWLLHAFLGADQAIVERIADVVEKVHSQAEAVRRYAESKPRAASRTATAAATVQRLIPLPMTATASSAGVEHVAQSQARGHSSNPHE